MSKNQYTKVSKEIIKYIGGKDNIDNVVHCATRLRFKLEDESKVDEDSLKKVDKVVGVHSTPNQYQIIIGNEVEAVFSELVNQGVSNGNMDSNSEDSDKKEENILQKIVDVITGCMTTMIPALTAAGMIKVVLSLIDQFNLVSADNITYQLFTIIGDAAFYFMPLVVAVFAANKFKVNTSLAVIASAILIHPNFVELVAADNASSLNMFGIPVAPVNYSYSIIPTILTVWMMSYIEKYVDKVTPKVLKIILNPTLVILITAPLALIVIGPLGHYAGQGLAQVVDLLQGTFGFLLVPILAAAMPFIVMTGMHHALTPIFLSTFAISGFDSLILLAQVCANLAQGGASLAVGIKSKDVKMKQLATASGISALMGITEPAIYGVTLKLKRPMIAAVIGAGIAGLYAGIMNVKIYVLNNSILTALAMADGTSNLVNGLIVLVLSVLVPLIIVFVIGLNKENE